MGVNKDGKAIRQIKVTEERLKGKSMAEIAKIVGTAKSTVFADLKEIEQDRTISEQIQWMKKFSLKLSQKAMVTEDEYIDQVLGQKEKKSQDMAVVTTIGEKSRKNYSFLEGVRSDNKGGDTLPEEMTREELIKLAHGENDPTRSDG